MRRPRNLERRHTLAFALFIVGLVATSWPRATGDGGEYLAMALEISEPGSPALGTDDIDRLREKLSAVDGIRQWDVVTSTHVSRFGTSDFVHFWFYSALAAPFVRLCDLAGVNPVYGFTVLNLLLLGLSFRLALPRLGSWMTWLLWAGPVLWWVDKPHTEVFTFSLLAVAVLLIAESPGWAFAAIGAAATQNPPIIIALPIAMVSLAVTGRFPWRSRSAWVGAGAGCALFGAHVLYYQLRHGTPFLLLGATTGTLPSLAELLVVPFDSSLGIAPAFPAFTLIVAIAVLAVLRRPRLWLAPDVLLSLGVLPFFLVSFTQTSNVHHGGTPGLSRYAIWLVPLAVPVLRAFRLGSHGWPDKVGLVLAIPSIVAAALVFHPAHPDNYREPTWLAHTLWTRYPSLTNPLPEIFVDVLSPRVEPTLPIATASCEKVLLVGRGESQGMWPMPCYPAEVPPECRQPAALCYANRTSAGYRFVPTRDPAGPRFKFARDRTWSQAAEPNVRKVFDGLGWQVLQAAAGASLVRGSREIGLVGSLEGTDRLLVVAARTGTNPEIDLQTGAKVSGTYLDPETGADLGPVVFRESPEAARLSVPANRAVVLIVLRRVPD